MSMKVYQADPTRDGRWTEFVNPTSPSLRLPYRGLVKGSSIHLWACGFELLKRSKGSSLDGKPEGQSVVRDFRTGTSSMHGLKSSELTFCN